MLPTQTLLKKFGTEKTLVILISRVYFKTLSAVEVQNFIDVQKFDWELCYLFIRRHGIRTFIYHSIQASGMIMPEDFLKKLKGDLMALSMTNLHQQKYLVELVRELTAAGIPVIPYKGISFAKAYYKSPSMRESSDIDLMINRRSVKPALKYFKRKGMPFKSGWEIPDEWLPYYLKIAKDLELKTPAVNNAMKCTVEIQWKLTELHMGSFPEFDFFIQGLEKNEQLNKGNGYPRLQPAYDFLCMASNHFIREPLMRFKYVIDTACLLQTAGDSIDGVLIHKTLKKYGHQRIVNASLSAIEELLGISNAQLPFDNIPDNELSNVATAYPVVKNTEKGNEHYPFFLNFQDSSWNKMKAQLRTLYYYVVPTASDIRYFKLPAVALPLLFIFRPFRLFFKLFAK
ncbi:nucleotidyltransferase family protein [Pedobacter sp. MC2016-14]|uniref:nucleotidyltransferase family protein n=1 Tax=Pedobacter sp. MC2016-14 TaxID=2897327 RepID=UPI001E649CC6|nr:nucleotidyltransferase family protein [Pedobacter sp. MC2016-14]MCD0486915.1 nucleotidyltransferase family protein [Pedobacter sp. MC2016-14]